MKTKNEMWDHVRVYGEKDAEALEGTNVTISPNGITIQSLDEEVLDTVAKTLARCGYEVEPKEE